MRYILTLTAFVFVSLSAIAQVGGNQLYKNNSSSYRPAPPSTKKNIVTTDSTLVIHVSVLLNKKAEAFRISLGLSEEAETVVACNEQINSRIDQLIEMLAELGIPRSEFYVDFISQTKVYDHKLEGNTVTEFFTGFEIRKNIIFNTRSIEKMDEIVERCSKVEVYDIIQVEYLNEGLDKINEQLFEEALKVIEQKRKRFLKASSVELSGRHRLLSEDLHIYYPKSLYQQYNEAYESSSINYYSSSYIKKEVRKGRTFYYEGLRVNDAPDRIKDEAAAEIGIQYLLEISMVYDLKP